MISFRGRGVLLDIEGTTSSISFVYDVLFPFVRQHVADFLQRHWSDSDVQRACERMARDTGAASLAAWTGKVDDAAARSKVAVEVHRLMDGDVKATGLKELQGLIWREGYAAGQLLSHVYADVPPALKLWRERGLDVCIYSSGSVMAQKQFFAHTEHGDLTRYLNGHYDTTTGPKREARSYTAIAGDRKLPPGEILFCSDVVAELDAAREVGMQTALVVRPGNATQPEGHGHSMIESLGEFTL